MNYCHPWEWKLWNAAHTSLSIFPAIPSHRASIRPSIRPSDKLLFRPIRNLVSVEIKLFNGKDGYKLFFEKWHPRSFHPTLLFPFEGMDEGWEGGRVIYIVEGVTGKPGILPVSAGCGHELSWAAWNISRQVSRTLVVRP